MKLIKFGSRYSFYNWFWRGNRNENYPLIQLNYPHCWAEDTHIYRAVENGKDVGVIFISCCFPGEMYIDLFEIKRNSQRKRLGTEMFNLLLKSHTPTFIQLQCVENDNAALSFWKKMGFHKNMALGFDDGLMYKKITKKYWKTA